MVEIIKKLIYFIVYYISQKMSIRIAIIEEFIIELSNILYDYNGGIGIEDGSEEEARIWDIIQDFIDIIMAQNFQSAGEDSAQQPE